MNSLPPIAFFSPFNPQRSGISDYSEELLPYLAPHSAVDLIVPDYRLSNEAIGERFAVRTLEDFRRNAPHYAGILYQIGNNYHHHAYMLPAMREFPGTCVVHDFCLQYLMLGFTVGDGDFPALVEALESAGHAEPRRDAMLLCSNLADAERYGLAPALLRMSRGAIVHSEYAANLVRRAVPELPVQVIPMAVPRGLASTPPGLLRERYGLRADDFVCASISTASKSKRLPLALRAVERAITGIPRLKFLVVGGGNVGDEARRMVRDLSLDKAVRFTGWLSAEDYRGLIDLAHVAMDLRYPSGAETSASLTRSLAAGKPLIVSRQGTFTELPDACAIKIPVEQGDEAQTVADALLRLANDPTTRESMAAAATDYSDRFLRLENAGEACAKFAIAAGAGQPPAWYRPWPSQRRRSPAVRLVYRATRSLHLLRRYGVRDTLRRLRAEWAARGQAGAAGL
jgi:glycosyltransferase involved in cell wall biosynthesis